jgi:hypothetical protein
MTSFFYLGLLATGARAGFALATKAGAAANAAALLVVMVFLGNS